jgi:DNA repair exonuclease SbcCD ATPase subunit
MSDLTNEFRHERGASPLLSAGLGIALLLGVGALVWSFLLQSRLQRAELALATARQETATLQNRMYASDARLRATSETFAQRLGTTQAQIDSKAQSILQKQNLDMARREEAEAKISANVNAVKTDVSTVKSDVGTVKTDVATTQADLADTKTQLQRTIGDAGVMSGLIARNHDELEELKHKGDRTYYEFTLQKGADPTLLSTIKLKLKKVDQKKGKFTLELNADDRVVEKKDKTLLEPVQFYSGKNPSLYEIVINNVAKNQVTGYLSVPKGQ